MDRLLFLDVDGVLNPWRATNLYGDWRKQPLDPSQPKRHRFWISADLGRWINTLVDDGIRIIWATTWIDHPVELAAYATLFGIPNFTDRIDAVLDDRTNQSGKLPGIQRWLNQHDIDLVHSRVAWVDDELGQVELDWATTNGVTVVRPDQSSGLADRNLRVAIERGLGPGVLA